MDALPTPGVTTDWGDDLNDAIESLHTAVVRNENRNSDPLGADLTKVGLVVELGGVGDPDEEIAEGPTILRDPKSGRYVMAYAGYDSSDRGRACYAYSDDLVTWDKQGVLLAHSGVGASPDQNGVTGPVLYWDDANSQYVLFYIGLTSVGYEAGTKSICIATADDLDGTWTRLGTVIAPAGSGWREEAVWHVSVVERDGTWYCFFNATGSDAKERIGYATAPAITGPWTVDDANSPLIDVVAATWESSIVGDPSVRRVGDLWVMDYFGFNGTNASDGIAVTPDGEFPLGWTKHPNNPILSPSESYDATYAHKPFVFVDGGRIFHYYTAVSAGNVRQIALAVSRDPLASAGLTVQDENGNVSTGVTQLDFQGAGVTAASGTGEVTVTVSGGGGGGSGQGHTDFARAKRTSGDITVNSTTFVNVDTGTDLVLAASAGDVIECAMNVKVKKSFDGSTYAVFDFHTIVGGSPVNSVTSEATAGTGLASSMAGWASGNVGNDGVAPYPFSAAGSKRYTLQAGDISGGTVTLRLRAFTGAECTVRATDPMLYIQATNLGPQL
jgi:predicted GH43/DUF377 family glycosyl hydrolase